MNGFAAAADVSLPVVILWDFELNLVPARATKLHYDVSLIKNIIIKFCGAECTAAFRNLESVILPFVKH